MITGAQEMTVSRSISQNVSDELTNDLLPLFDWQALRHQRIFFFVFLNSLDGAKSLCDLSLQ